MIKVYTKENCPQCNMVKRELSNRQFQYEEYNIGLDVSREWILDNFSDMRSAPIVVFENGQYGGYNWVLEKIKEM